MRASSIRAAQRRETVARRCAVIVAVALAGPITLAAGAPPALASYASESTDSTGQTTLLYYAEMFDTDFGKANTVAMSQGPATFTLSEWTPGMTVAVGPGCARGSGGTYQVVCPSSGVSWVNMFLGDGDDTAVTLIGVKAIVDGGTGSDTLTGGAGNDFLYGGSGDDHLHGSAGFDSLWPQGGNDQLDGGDGFDMAHYDDYWTPVTVTLNGVADDGAAGERQNADTEGVHGGNAADTLTGNKQANIIAGLAGDDVIDGGPGADHLYGEDGDDTFWALDHQGLDSISCGDGYDTVLADRRDSVSDDCESVSRP
jgi:Ca2+-binding RTX toxin-like protein